MQTSRRRLFSDLVIIRGTRLDPQSFPTVDKVPRRNKNYVENEQAMYMTYNRELKKFLGELIAKNATCIHVDFHFTKGDPNALEHTAKQKLKQYKAAFQYFEEKGNSEDATPTIREIYQMMSHMGRGGKLFEPKVITFGVSYAGVFSESALSFMHWLSTIKFPAGPGCWNYKMMRSHWVKTWCKVALSKNVL